MDHYYIALIRIIMKHHDMTITIIMWTVITNKQGGN